MEELKAAIADCILPHVDLDAISRALQVRKTCLPHQSEGNDTSSHSHVPAIGFQFGCGSLSILADQGCGGLCPAKFARKGVEARRPDLFKFLLALLKLVARLKLQVGKFLSGSDCASIAARGREEQGIEAEQAQLARS